MSVFYRDCNNGVYAVVEERIMEELLERRRLSDDLRSRGLPDPIRPPVRPVFTFGRSDHPSFRFMTGSIVCMHRLLRGHQVFQGSIWVPFSNGIELNGGQDDFSQKDADWELLNTTSLDEAMKAFELQPSRN